MKKFLLVLSFLMAFTLLSQIIAMGEAEEIVISGKDGSWHTVSLSLRSGSWYEITLESTVQYSASESRPSQLHVDLDHGPYGRFTFLGEGRDVIREVITIVAQQSKIKIRLHDGPRGYGDNSGSLVVRITQLGS